MRLTPLSTSSTLPCRTLGEGGNLRDRKRALSRDQVSEHLDLGLPSLHHYEKINLCCLNQTFWYAVWHSVCWYARRGPEPDYMEPQACEGRPSGTRCADLLIFSFWECSPSSTAPSGSIITLFWIMSWNILAIGILDPSWIISGSVPNTETKSKEIIGINIDKTNSYWSQMVCLLSLSLFFFPLGLVPAVRFFTLCNLYLEMKIQLGTNQ